MGNIRLTLACEDYDRTRPLKDGIIMPEGIDLNYLVLSVEEIFWRMMKYEEFDASELSMGAFLTAAAQGRRPFIAIPVFPSRTFRHRCIFVNMASGIERPEDLRGKRMGVPELLIADPDAPSLRLYVLRDGRYDQVEPDGDGRLHSTVVPGLVLDPATLLADLHV